MDTDDNTGLQELRAHAQLRTAIEKFHDLADDLMRRLSGDDLITAVEARINDQFGRLPSLETEEGIDAHTEIIACLIAGFVRDFCRLHGDDEEAAVDHLSAALAGEGADLYVGTGWPPGHGQDPALTS